MKRLLGILVFVSVSAFGTGIPVLDVSNLAENIVTAFNAVKNTAVQAEQYVAQVRQLELALNSYIQQLKDGLGLTELMKVYWDAQQTMAQLQQLRQFAMGQGGQLQNYLQQFQDVNYWSQTNPANYGVSWTGSGMIKQADDSWVQSLQMHEQLLARDSQRLEQAQTASADAQGQMQAIQAAAQIAVSTDEQLMEIHSLMVQEQQALAARQLALDNRDAQQAAADQQFLHSDYQHYQGTTWGMP